MLIHVSTILPHHEWFPFIDKRPFYPQVLNSVWVMYISKLKERKEMPRDLTLCECCQTGFQVTLEHVIYCTILFKDIFLLPSFSLTWELSHWIKSIIPKGFLFVVASPCIFEKNIQHASERSRSSGKERHHKNNPNPISSEHIFSILLRGPDT